MEPLNLPPHDLNIKSDGQNTYIFDVIRKKFLVLTPEEWVRQNFVHYLIEDLHYPAPLMMTENGLKLFNTQKRSDIVIYDRNGSPLVVVECKAADVKITQETFNQVARYNIKFKAPLIIVTNGLNHYCAKFDAEKSRYTFLKEIPKYDEIIIDGQQE
ncbi:MAG: type I restriction enzyme HsdR N-terminal domain-containing protein [Bacteroidales bacterium]|nr:type I restriction enzyme HsdR N-terminal domain-containing protein [Bacteroidales bacterium]MBO7567178.1 type I restriction enzyme HsdR N-terminal domain-containing protein [Bacteroidales bacterium]